MNTKRKCVLLRSMVFAKKVFVVFEMASVGVLNKLNYNQIFSSFYKSAACNVLINNSISSSSVLMRSQKHWNQKFRKLRSQKVMKVPLLDYEEATRPFYELSKEEVRSKLKEKGVQPMDRFQEKPMFISTIGEIIEPYVPPEGDGKVSFITKEGAKQKLDFVGKKGKSMLAIRKLRKQDDDFEIDEFLVLAQDIYMKAHTAMMNVRKDKDELLLYVTERAYPEMLHNSMNKTIHWKMIGLLEEPRLVHARTTDIITKENLFTQLTVRFNTQQMLAVYDRFGRLMYGSEILAKDVLEYVVFEKHITNKYGSWRIHGKIIPDWMPPKDSVPKTFRMIEEQPYADLPAPESKAIPPPSDSPQLASA